MLYTGYGIYEGFTRALIMMVAEGFLLAFRTERCSSVQGSYKLEPGLMVCSSVPELLSCND